MIDLVGKKFGLLRVVERTENDKNGSPKWLCLCDCGNSIVVYGSCLRYGITKSCGCMRKEWNSNKHKKHEQSNSKLYGVWRSMKYRCNNPNCHAYENYGGRGIRVCDEWNGSFLSFMCWANEAGYKEGLSLDRIDVNGNYTPDNCRWATAKIQTNNQRNNRLLEYNDEIHTVSEWSEITGISRSAIYGRLKCGWSIDMALTKPVQTRLAQ